MCCPADPQHIRRVVVVVVVAVAAALISG